MRSQIAIVAVMTSLSCAQTVSDFESGDATPFESTHFAAEPGPVVENGSLSLVNPVRVRDPQRNAVAFGLTDPGCHAEIETGFRFTLGFGAHGMGFALLSTEHHGEEGPPPDIDWEAPNLPGSLAIGFDTHNPPTSAWFNGYGNVYDRPQRELSLHYDGVELAKVRSPVEFRGWEPHEFRMNVRFVPGGAHVSAWIDAAAIWDDQFFAGIRAYESRVALGARTGETKTNATIDDLRVEFREPGDCETISPEPTVAGVFADENLFGGRRNIDAVVSLPELDNIERIVGVLTLKPGPGGWDKWDKSAAIYAWRGEGDDAERFEIVRYITPYRREWTWRVDLTDFAPLLRGDVKMGLFADSWQGKADTPEEQKAFNVTFDLEYYTSTNGPVRNPRVLGIQNLWNTTYRFGNTQHEIDAAFQPITVTVPEGATAARVRTSVTGHGGFGEFTPNTRTLVIDDVAHTNELWKDDVYLNPVRPQSGTWKFDRAGWSPGDVVAPWIVEVPADAMADGAVTIRYRPSVFEGEIGDANHWIESQIIFYGHQRDPAERP